MVKVENEYGDQYTGKSSNAIYQGHYGRTIRRKSYKETQNPSHSQVKTRNRFKEAIKNIKTLSYEDKQGIKKLYNYLKEKNPHQYPVNWYNFAKWLHLKKPELTIINKTNKEYQIKHISIYQIQEYSAYGTLLYDTGILSDPFNLSLLQTFIKIPDTITTILRIFPVPSIYYDIKFKPATTGLKYFDSRFFDSRYFT